MRLFSYIVTHDGGFAPNPFWGYCTLTNCKPAIRRAAHVGDWIVGLSSKARGNRLIYAMRVDEILTYEQYYLDSRFAAKIPDYTKGKIVHRCGDNIYKPLPDGKFQQVQSVHSDGPNENPKQKVHDLNGKFVLVSKRFYYFGSRAIELPQGLNELRVGQAHKNRFAPDVIDAFLKFIVIQPEGVNAPPSRWKSSDSSWKMNCR